LTNIGLRCPIRILVEFAHNYKVDVIVIGIKKTSRVEKMLFGSTAQKVILDAPCPVLTVK